MNKTTLLITMAVTALFHLTAIQAKTKSAKFYGARHLAHQTYTDLEIYGSGHLNNIIVTGTAFFGGSAHLIDFKCPHLTVKGSLNCTNISVDTADISGSFHCKDGLFNTLSINGSCIVQDIKVNTKFSVYGSLIATDMICPLVEVKAARIELNNVAIATLLVKETYNTYKGIFNLWGLLSWGTSTPRPSELYLDGGSIDSIIFQGPSGQVFITHQSNVGEVINGTIIKR